jgi:hypothetical protein
MLLGLVNNGQEVGTKEAMGERLRPVARKVLLNATVFAGTA